MDTGKLAQNSFRSGPSWDAMLSRYRIQGISNAVGGGWTVLSSSGSTYHVTRDTRLDEMGSMFFTMRCDCPARKTCRHINAVVDMMHGDEAVADEPDYEALERIEL